MADTIEDLKAANEALSEQVATLTLATVELNQTRADIEAAKEENASLKLAIAASAELMNKANQDMLEKDNEIARLKCAMASYLQGTDAGQAILVEYRRHQLEAMKSSIEKLLETLLA